MADSKPVELVIPPGLAEFGGAPSVVRSSRFKVDLPASACPRSRSRRFLPHVLPRGFVKIRYYGFLAPRRRTAGLARCRELLPVSPTAEAAGAVLSDVQRRAVERRCPHCGEGRLRIVQWLSALELELRARNIALPETIDSS